jgi:hypothetical protein
MKETIKKIADAEQKLFDSGKEMLGTNKYPNKK